MGDMYNSGIAGVGAHPAATTYKPTGTTNNAVSTQQALNATFNNLEQNVTGPYNAGYAAGQSALDLNDLYDMVMSHVNLSDPSNYLQSALDLSELNTQASQALAREQMAWQEKANAKAMDFSATEAQKTRDWQSMMANTAHQREVEDLIKAGLNPILSANAGAQIGSAANAQGVTSSGAKGTVDTSAVQALTQAYVQARQIEIESMKIGLQEKQIDAQMAMNMMTNETTRYAADRSAQASMYGSNLSSSAHRYAAELDYSTWANGLHNQYAQLGEWIYKALTGMDLSNIFDFSLKLGNEIKNVIPEEWKNAEYSDNGASSGAGGGGGGGGEWKPNPKGYEAVRR